MSGKKSLRVTREGNTSNAIRSKANGSRGVKAKTRTAATAISRATVPQILRQIDQLTEADRLRLERTLARRAEAEWLREARRARRLVGERGIDQAAIDRTVEDVRYQRRH